MAVNSLEVVRPFKSCKWNTHFHRKNSNGKTGLPFQKFRLFRKISSGTNQKRVFHLHPNRNFRNFLVNGKRPGKPDREPTNSTHTNQTQATMPGGECFHHCAIPVPSIYMYLHCIYLLCICTVIQRKMLHLSPSMGKLRKTLDMHTL